MTVITTIKNGKPVLPVAGASLSLVACDGINYYTNALPVSTENKKCVCHVVYKAEDDATMQSFAGRVDSPLENTDYKIAFTKTELDGSSSPAWPFLEKGYKDIDKSLKDDLNVDGAYFKSTIYSQALKVEGLKGMSFTNCVFDGCNLKDKTSGGQIVSAHGKNNVPAENIRFHNCTVKDGGNILGFPQYGGGLCINAQSKKIIISGSTITNNVETNSQAYSSVDGKFADEILWVQNRIFNKLPFDNNYETGINFGFRCINSIARLNDVYNCRIPIQVDALTNNNQILFNRIWNGKDALIRILSNSHGECNNVSVVGNHLESDNGHLMGLCIAAWDGVGGRGHKIQENNFYTTTPGFNFINVSDSRVVEYKSDFNTYVGPGVWVQDGEIYPTLKAWQDATGQDLNSKHSS